MGGLLKKKEAYLEHNSVWIQFLEFLEIGFSIEELHHDNYILHRQNKSHHKV